MCMYMDLYTDTHWYVSRYVCIEDECITVYACYDLLELKRMCVYLKCDIGASKASVETQFEADSKTVCKALSSHRF